MSSAIAQLVTLQRKLVSDLEHGLEAADEVRQRGLALKEQAEVQLAAALTDQP